jgi:hypothetical protein
MAGKRSPEAQAVRDQWEANRQKIGALVDRMMADNAPDALIQETVKEARQRLSQKMSEQRAVRLGEAEKQYGEDTDVGSVLKGAGSDIKEKLVGLARGGKKLAEIGGGLGRIGVTQAFPLLEGVVDDGGEGNAFRQMMTNPAARREAGRGLSDTMFGLPTYLADKVGAPTYSANEAADAADPTARDYRTAMQIGGSLTPGTAANLTGRGALALARKAPIAPFLKNILAGQLTAAGTAAGMQPGNITTAEGLKAKAEAALGAASDPLNAALPIAGGAGAGLARGTSNLLRKNRQIGTRARAMERGAYQDPEMLALEAPELGLKGEPMPGKPSPELQIRRAADKGLNRVLNRMQEMGTEEGQAYQSATNPIGPRTPARPPNKWVEPDPEIMSRMDRGTLDRELLAAEGRQPPMAVEGQSFPQEGLAAQVDRPALEAAIRESASRNINPDTGLPYNKAIDKRVTRLLKELGPATERVTTDVTVDVPKPTTLGGVLGQRRALKGEAAFESAAPTDKQKAAQAAYGAYRGAVRKASPEVIAPADDRYAAFARKRTRAEQILGVEDEVAKQSQMQPLTESEAPFELADEIAPEKTWSLPVGKEKTAATNLARVNDTNVPGVNMAKYLEELRRMDPEFDKAIQFIADKKALEATKFGFHGHLPESLHSVKAAVGPALRQNVRALGAGVESVANRAAGADLGAGRLAPTLALNPVLRAYQAQQAREQQAAENLRQDRERKATQQKLKKLSATGH